MLLTKKHKKTQQKLVIEIQLHSLQSRITFIIMSEFKYIKKKSYCIHGWQLLFPHCPLVVHERFLLCANVLIVFSFPSDFFPSLHSEAVLPGL